jgi:hypothetical protein
MVKSSWLNEVTHALRREGMSRTYIRRFTDELADHYEDHFQETPGMDADAFPERIGSPAELARTAAFEFRRRTYAGRHPLVTFVAAPLPTAAVLLVALCATFLLVLSIAPENSTIENHIPFWAAAIMQSLVWAMRTVPFVAGALLFCHLARRTLCGPRGSFIACSLVALLAGLFAVNLRLPTNGPGSGALTLGFAIPPAPMRGSKLSLRLPFGWFTQHASWSDGDWLRLRDRR